MINAERLLSPLILWKLTTAQRDALTDLVVGMEIFNTDDEKKNVYTTAGWVEVGGGGAGVGGFPLVLYPGNQAGAPPAEFTGNLNYFRFEPSDTNELRGAIKVPASYEAGDQIFLRSHFFPQVSSGTGLFSATTYLVRVGTDTVGSTTNSHASTNSAVSSLSSGRVEQSIMDLTDSSGEINSVAVSPNDMLQIVITRGTDTNTDFLGLLENSSEVILG